MKNSLIILLALFLFGCEESEDQKSLRIMQSQFKDCEMEKMNLSNAFARYRIGEMYGPVEPSYLTDPLISEWRKFPVRHKIEYRFVGNELQLRYDSPKQIKRIHVQTYNQEDK